jgi:hypothetical protein
MSHAFIPVSVDFVAVDLFLAGFFIDFFLFDFIVLDFISNERPHARLYQTEFPTDR